MTVAVANWQPKEIETRNGYSNTYRYDTMGRMKELGTPRDGQVWDWTGWHYDPVTGLATHKVFADDSAVAYTYTADGKPLRTTSARGSWRENVYDTLGRLGSTSHSDGESIGLGYDAFSRIASASNAVAAYVYARSSLGIVTNEAVRIGAESQVLIRTLDDRSRIAKLELLGTDGVPMGVAQYVYDAEGRLAIVSNAAFSVSYAFSDRGLDLGYTLPRPNGVSLTRSLTRNGWRHELIPQVKNAVSTGHTNTLVYAYDDAGRRTARNADSFGYNPRSEITSAAIATNAYSYAYDHIGSHTTSTVNSATTTYTANSLNQYTSILCAPAGAILRPGRQSARQRCLVIHV